MKPYQTINMKALKLITCLCAMAAIPAYGQTAASGTESITRNVTVEKAYDPTSIEVNKISPVPPKEEYTPEQPSVTYSTWSKAEEVNTTPDKLKAEQYENSETADIKKGIFKAGLGFYWQVLGEFYYPLLQGDKYLLDVNLKHLSNWSNIRLEDGTVPRAMTQNTSANVTFESQFRDARLNSALDFSYNGFDYYGKSTVPLINDPIKDTIGTYTTVGLNFNLFSTNTKKAFQYNTTLGYDYFGRNFGVSNNCILVKAELGGEVGNGELGTDIDIDTNIKGITEESTGTHKSEAGCLISIMPYYKLIGKTWDLKIGGNLYILAAEATKRPVTGSANIEGRFGLVPGLFHLYTGIKGSFVENTYPNIIKENPYIKPLLNIEPTYTPLNISFGMKVNIMEGLLFDLGFDYSLILDQYYYVNDTINGNYYNTFDVTYENTTNKVSIEAGLYFDYIKNLNVSLVGKYNYWGVTDNQFAWQKPAWEIKLEANYTIKEKWQIGLSYNFLGGRFARVGTDAVPMTDIHDLNIYVSYKALDWLSVFANGKNLINIQADKYYGYRNFGINGMIGATFSF
ncbi:MAG: hypothetical protein EOL95_00635 [Bacteroidia bacterium]|nr:hypothetical protein [Bacteroidia bacterium]